MKKPCDTDDFLRALCEFIDPTVDVSTVGDAARCWSDGHYAAALSYLPREVVDGLLYDGFKTVTNPMRMSAFSREILVDGGWSVVEVNDAS